MASSDEVVLRDLIFYTSACDSTLCKTSIHHNTCDRAKENRVGRQVRCETTATLEEIPRKHAEANNSRNITTPANILCQLLLRHQSQLQLISNNARWSEGIEMSDHNLHWLSSLRYLCCVNSIRSILRPYYKCKRTPTAKHVNNYDIKVVEL